MLNSSCVCFLRKCHIVFCYSIVALKVDLLFSSRFEKLALIGHQYRESAPLTDSITHNPPLLSASQRMCSESRELWTCTVSNVAQCNGKTQGVPSSFTLLLSQHILVQWKTYFCIALFLPISPVLHWTPLLTHAALWKAQHLAGHAQHTGHYGESGQKDTL